MEDEHKGTEMSTVIYIGAAPWCERNLQYLERQKIPFLEGQSAPKFSAEDCEVRNENRAQLEDLTPLGRRQMGFEAW